MSGDLPLVWRKVATKGETPPPRYGHSLTFVGDSAYVFGGVFEEKEDQTVLYQDMYRLDVTTSPPTWSKVAQKGAIPPKREGHSVTAVGRTLYLFGGMGANKDCYDDFYAFDTATSTWTAVKGKGTAPSKRNNHAACAVGAKIFIFGGFLSGVAGNDVHCYDSTTGTWTQPPIKGPVPVERVDHTWTPFGNKLVLFGGAGDNVWYNDLHVYNTETSTWSNPATKGNLPAKRDYHTMVNFDEKHLILFGGANESDDIVHFGDVHVFSTPTLTWSLINPPTPGPSKRWAHAAGMARGAMWLFGGTTDGKHFDDLWALSLPNAAPLNALPVAAPSSPVVDDGVPKKPPRNLPAAGGSQTALASPVAAVPAGKLAPGLTAVQPIPPAKPSYATPTPAPAPRKVAPTVKPFVPTPRSLKNEYQAAAAQLQKIFDDLEVRYNELDNERAAFVAERKEFAEEVRLNLEQYEQQQREVADLIEKHRRENEELLAKRQAQYEAQLQEIQRKQSELTERENKLAVANVEFDDKKKKIEALMAQFTRIQT